MHIERLTDSVQLDEADRDALTECWAAVTNAGGAVGFPFPPVALADVAPATERLVADLDPQTCILFRAVHDGGLHGWVVLRRSLSPLVRHWGVVERLQSHPKHRGRGTGAALLADVEQHARAELGLEQLHLAARSGLGLEDYYRRLGWHEVGRWPGALRLAPGDDRDDVMMFRQLD